MTPDQWRDLGIVGVIVGVMAVSIFLVLNYIYRSYRREAISQFRSFYGNNQKLESGWELFTYGHITWSEITPQEVEARIARSCLNWYMNTIVPIPVRPEFTMHKNDERKSIYIIFGEKGGFDWESVPHYEDYVSDARGRDV